MALTRDPLTHCHLWSGAENRNHRGSTGNETWSHRYRRSARRFCIPKFRYSTLQQMTRQWRHCWLPTTSCFGVIVATTSLHRVSWSLPSVTSVQTSLAILIAWDFYTSDRHRPVCIITINKFRWSKLCGDVPDDAGQFYFDATAVCATRFTEICSPGQILTGQLLTGQMLTALSTNRTNAHKIWFWHGKFVNMDIDVMWLIICISICVYAFTSIMSS